MKKTKMYTYSFCNEIHEIFLQEIYQFATITTYITFTINIGKIL